MPARVIPVLLASALALAAFLLFFMQPLAGRMLLPLVGGAPAGWLVVLCFFQLALLAGYALARLLAAVSLRLQLVAVLTLLGTAFGFTRFGFSTTIATPGAIDVLALLASHVGLAAMALALLSPLLQQVAARQLGLQNPYRLYVASNAGSLLGLLCYPLVVEPLLTLALQQQLWFAGLGVLAVICSVLLVFAKSDVEVQLAPAHVTGAHRRSWIWLAFVPAALSVALAGLLSTEFGAVPLVWMLPLLLYLLSFIVVFGWPQHRILGRAGLISNGLLLAAGLALVLSSTREEPAFLLLCFSFFMLALAAHGRLVALRPAPAGLVGFYLVVAFGGALGGVFCTVLVPVLLHFPVEYGVLAGAFALTVPAGQPYQRAQRVFGGVLLAGCAALLVVMQFAPNVKIYRNFYGVSQVMERRENNGELHRYLISGGGIQGGETIEPKPKAQAGYYFAMLQPVFAQEGIRQVGVIGAGVGIASCYNAPGRSLTFYEIDPKHRAIAEEQFAYFKLCGTPYWRMGDGRLELQSDIAARYDVLIIDAFQGGQIPLHLLTREAFSLYRSRLNAGGILLYNLNSVYYDFYPQLFAQAKAQGWQMWKAPNTWALLAAPDVALDFLRFNGWSVYETDTAPAVWTDDYRNLLGALR